MSEMNISLEELLAETPISAGKLSLAQDVSNPNALEYCEIPGMTTLSFSKVSKLHECPRKFLLENYSQDSGEREETLSQNFGHSFGVGVQTLWETGSKQIALARAFAHWCFDVDAEDKYTSRNIWHCMASIEEYYFSKYIPMRAEGWELYYHQREDGQVRAGIELFWVLGVRDTYLWQGHIDLVLKNVHTNEVRVQEFKTSKYAQSAANWQNSEQTALYTVILGAVIPDAGDFKVTYVIASTKVNPEPLQEYTFRKGNTDILGILTQLDLDCITVGNYLQVGYFPKYGSSCMNYNRQCKFFGLCDHMESEAIHNMQRNYEIKADFASEIEAWKAGEKHSAVDIMLSRDTLLALIADRIENNVDESSVESDVVNSLLED